MKKLIFTSALLFGICFLSMASGNLKTTELKGSITDRSGQPLVGVKVYVPSLEKHVYTDFDGQFSIKDVPLKEQSLKITYISFEEKEVNLDLSTLNSSLHLELQSK